MRIYEIADDQAPEARRRSRLGFLTLQPVGAFIPRRRGLPAEEEEEPAAARRAVPFVPRAPVAAFIVTARRLHPFEEEEEFIYPARRAPLIVPTVAGATIKGNGFVIQGWTLDVSGFLLLDLEGEN